MQINNRSNPAIAKAALAIPDDAVNHDDNVLVDKAGIDPGFGTIDGQIPDIVSPVQSSFILVGDPGGVPAATDGDGSASGSESLSADPLLASSDTSPDPVHPTPDPFEALLTEARTVARDVIGT